ncbi:MAG: response regulator, partial [Alphaproteobacteria bacterium]
LAICKHLIQNMGSSIQVKSEEGQGSTFFFSLLMEEGNKDIVEQSQNQRNAGSIPSQKILVIEDNQVNRRVIAGLLEKLDHRPHTVASGEEALNKITQEQFDLVITDVNLEGMSGIETTKTIRSLPDKKKASIPIVALSGNVQKSDIDSYYAAGMNDFLAKPIDHKKLENVILELCGQGSKATPSTPLNTQASKDQPAQQNEKAANITHASAPKDNDYPTPAEPITAPEPEQKREPRPPLPTSENASRPEKRAPQPQDKNLSEPASTPQKQAAQNAIPQIMADNHKPPQQNPLKQNELTDLQKFLMEEDDKPPAEKAASGPPPSSPPPAGLSPIAEAETFEEEGIPKDLAPNDQNTADSGIDGELLESLYDTLGKDQLQPLLDDYYTFANQIIETLQGQKDAPDASIIRDKAHELKGMAANFGFSGISKIGGEIEALAKKGSIEQTLPLIAQLDAINQKSQNAARQWLGGKS